MEMIIAELHDQSRANFRRSRVVFNAAQRLTGYAPEATPQEQSELAGLGTADEVLRAAREVHETAVHLKSEVIANSYLYPTEAGYNFRLNRVCDAAGSALHAQALLALAAGDQVLGTSLSAQATAVFAEADEYRRRGMEMELGLRPR